MENKLLLDRLGPFIGPHQHFDIVLSKFGPVYVYPVDSAETVFEAYVLDGAAGIIETVALQMVCDRMEDWEVDRISPTVGDVRAIRSRIQALVSGLEQEDEYMAALERYFAQYPQENAAP